MKVPQQLSDPISENLQKLAALFPAAVKDGMLDVESLREELGDFAEIQPGDEKYELNWVGKQAAKKKTFEPLLGKTLALKEDGKHTDTTQNLYIEGDNLEALKLLRQNYYGEVKMIYIDPPYNTGNDFVYTDKFKVSQEESEEEEGAVSESGERLVKNEKTSNRFHARWLDMMYPRLRLAKDLLREDGVIFISIDDNEVHNLREICDEVFGENNFVANVAWKHTEQSKNDEPYFSRNYNALLIYRKSIACNEFRLPRSEKDNKHYSNPDSDKNGDWRSGDVRSPSPRPSLRYSIKAPDGSVIQAPENGWRWSESETKRKIATGEISFKPDNSGIIRKIYLNNQRGRTPENLWSGEASGTTRQANSELKALFDEVAGFDTPKPTSLIKQIGRLFSLEEANYIVLDFFSGSATTAHAVMQLNAEDSGSRKHIMVQLPEVCDAKSEAAKAGYKTIAEIGKARIRRAGEKIVADLNDKLLMANGELEKAQAKLAELEQNFTVTLGEKQQEKKAQLGESINHSQLTIHNLEERISSLDIGFKSFRIEDTKINWLKKDLRGEEFDFDTADISDKDALDFVPGTTDHNVVYELMLRQSNIPLTLPITQPVPTAKRTYLYGDAYLICLEEEISNTLVASLAALEPTPLKYFFRDSAFGKDIAFKDETFRRLNAEIAKNTADQADAYTVEFI
jgi:adenine-specific DNA-methyltransferase